MYLTAPDINSLENTGIMGFYTGTFNSDGLLIRNKGILNLKTQDIHANGTNGMQIHNSGKLNADVPTINATLMLVDNDGIMSLNNSDIKGGSLTIDNSGKIDLSANVEGSSAKLKNSGISRIEGSFALTGNYDCANSGKLTIEGGVKGATAELKNSGIYKMEGSFSLTDAYTYTNSGRSDITGNVTARTISMKNSGIDDKHGALKADQLTMRTNGRSNYDISFKGGDAQVNCSGIGSFVMALECRSIEIKSSGRIKVTLSGTADKTTFDGSGVSHIDTSKLNKF